MEFLDMDGHPLEIGDEIEYWSPSNKDWLRAEVATIEVIRQSRHVPDGAGGYEYKPETLTKIKVKKWDDRYKQFKNYDHLNLRKSESIRKVF